MKDRTVFRKKLIAYGRHHRILRIPVMMFLIISGCLLRIWDTTFGRFSARTALKVFLVLPCLAVLAAALTLFSAPDAVISSSSEILDVPPPEASDVTPEPEAVNYIIDSSGCFIVYTYEGLLEFARRASDNPALGARLAADINVPDGNLWDPIPSYRGSFDGGGFAVSGLNIEGGNHAGFFGFLDGGTVTGLTLSDCIISGAESIGGICGRNAGTITECRFEGFLEGQDNGIFAGGIAGSNEGLISGCSSSGYVGAYSYAGGIAGINYADISECSNSGRVSGTTAAGGIAGINEDGTIDGCLSMEGAAVYAGTGSGGITGINNSFGILIDCKNVSSGISAGTASGAIAGINYGKLYGCSQSSSDGEQIFDSAVTVGFNYGTIEDKTSHDGN